MPDFPRPEQIISDLNDLQPYIKKGENSPRRGEVDVAEWLVDFSNRWGLGEVKKHMLPKGSKFEKFRNQESELANVTIDLGMDRAEELLILHGHFDIVPPFGYGDSDAAIIQHESREHIYKGLGCYDMLGGIAAILTSLRGIQLASHRGIRAILVFGEENDSEGTHAAFDSRNNLFNFDGKRVALTTEITVGSTINDPYHLVVGRPGRVEFRADIYGKSMHIGDITESDFEHMTDERASRVKYNLKRMQLQRHPRDVRGILKPGMIMPSKYHSSDPESLSSPDVEHIKLDVHYADPDQGVMQLDPLIRQKITEVLGDNHFALHPNKRDMPWTKPWLEDLGPNNPFPLTIQKLANRVVEGFSRTPIEFRTGSGVADDNIIAEHNIPVVDIPSRGEGAHRRSEIIDIRSITEFQIPVIQAAAGYELSLADG